MKIIIIVLLVLIIVLIFGLINNDFCHRKHTKCENANSNYNKGLEYFALEDYVNAHKYMSEVIKINDKNYFAYFIRGRTDFEINVVYSQNAIKDLEEAIKLKPDFIQCKRALSSILLQFLEGGLSISGLGGYFTPEERLMTEIYLDELDKIIELDSKNHKAYYYRALRKTLSALENRKNDTLSETELEKIDDILDYDKAIEHLPYLGLASYYLARAISKHFLHADYSDAIEDYKKYLSAFGKDFDLFLTKELPKHEIWFRIGQCYLVLKNEDDAMKSFDKAKLLCPYGEYADFEKKINDLIQKFRDSED